MDIESRHYRLRTASTMPGRVEITIKRNREATAIPRDLLPSVNALAMMKEREFNRAIAEALAQDPRRA